MNNKKLIYKQNKIEKVNRLRQERKLEKQTGKTGTRRLAFLEYLIYARGYNHSTIASKLGCTQQNVHWMFSVVDTCKLSRAQQIGETLGYSIRVHLEKDSLEGAFTGTISFAECEVPNRIICNGVNLSKKRPYPKVPTWLLDCPEEARLHFLAEFLLQLKVGIREFEKKCGFHQGAIWSWFLKDDIDVGNLYKIAKCAGAEIEWIVNDAS
jgi:hypothetical protein